MATPVLVTVTGHIAGQGTVAFTRHRALVSSVDDSVIPPTADIAMLDEDGNFTIDLYATDDPDWLPVDWAYSVRVNAGGGTRGSMQLDYQSPAADFDDAFQPGGNSEAGQSYVRLTDVGQAGGVAGLDEDGTVPIGQLPDLGAVDSVNGQTGTVLLEASDIGIYVGPSAPVGAVDGNIWFDTSGV